MKVKKLLSFVMVIATLLALSVPALAEESNPDILQVAIAPRWIQIDEVSAAVSTSGSTVYYSVCIFAKSPSANISGTMYLQEYSSGGWTTVDRYSIRDTGSAVFEESYAGSDGTRYRAKVVVTVAGESATAYSDSITL